jgi:hypothetical protein
MINAIILTWADIHWFFFLLIVFEFMCHIILSFYG